MKEPLQKRKVVVRHLPPSLSQSDLVSQIDPRFSDRYNWLSFRPGKSSYKNQKYSRAYIGFKAPEDVYEFAAFFNGHVFVNEKGAQFKAIVEYAPSQRVPKQSEKKDPREGSISKDPDYLEFLKLISKPVEYLPSAEIQLERRDAVLSGSLKAAPIVTPLMDFIRQKRATLIASHSHGGLSDVRRGSRRARAVSANKPSPRPSSKRNSENKKYVEKESSKNVVPRKDNLQPNASENITGGGGYQPSAIVVSGEKKILLLKSKDPENPDNPLPQPDKQIKTILSRSSPASRQNQMTDVNGRLIKGILIRSEPPRPSQSQSSSNVQPPEQRVESTETENNKRPQRQANPRAGGFQSNQERRTRNKERPDRVVWAPLRRGDGPNSIEDQLSSPAGSSVANNGEVGNSLENGTGRNSSRRVGGRNRKDESFMMNSEGKSSRRGGAGGPNSNEKQMWIQKSSPGT